MGGWTDGRMDGWTGGRMDGWTDGGWAEKDVGSTDEIVPRPRGIGCAGVEADQIEGRGLGDRGRPFRGGGALAGRSSRLERPARAPPPRKGRPRSPSPLRSI